MSLRSRASSIGALADDTRRELYELVVGAQEPVGREQAARALCLPLRTVAFHLDRLADEGLLEVEFRRLTGRTGPGAGRPSKLYRRAAREVGAGGLCLGGGVAANSQLRERFVEACKEDGLRPFVPSIAMCTDNAAMIAAAGWWLYRRWREQRRSLPTEPDEDRAPADR